MDQENLVNFNIETFDCGLEESDKTKEETKIEDNLNIYQTNKNTYFVFIDVLGFKETYNFPKSKNRFEKVFSTYLRFMDEAEFNIEGANTYYGQTSDSLYFYTTEIQKLIGFIKFFSYFNCIAMQNNVFFRGGIAKGELKTKNPYQFLGDSVIKAYLLESEIAKNPRIAIDKKSYEELKRNKDILEHIQVDKKNERYYLKLFVKNLKLATIFSSEVDLEDIDYDTIKRNINKCMKTNEFNDSIYRKYNFINDEIIEFEREK